MPKTKRRERKLTYNNNRLFDRLRTSAKHISLKMCKCKKVSYRHVYTDDANVFPWIILQLQVTE